MKTLINKTNPQIRITAPEIELVHTEPIDYWRVREVGCYAANAWELKEEETIVETIKEFVEKGERCMQQAVEDQNPGNYTFWDGFHNCAENILREVEEPTDDWREKRKKECPFRKADGCERYANVISECTGACSWVVDYPKLKEIQDKKKQEQPEEICSKCVYHKKDDGYCYYPNGGMKRRINENGVCECTGFCEKEQEEPKRKQSPALKKIVDNLTEEKLAKTRAEMKTVEEEPTEVEEEHPDNFTSFEWLVGRLMFRGCDLWGMTDGEDDNGIVTKLIKDRAAEMMGLLERELDPNAEPVDLEKEIKKHTDLFHADIEYPLRLTAIKFYELGKKGGNK